MDLPCYKITILKSLITGIHFTKKYLSFPTKWFCDPQTKLKYFLQNDNLVPLDIHKGLPQIFCIKPDGVRKMANFMINTI